MTFFRDTVAILPGVGENASASFALERRSGPPDRYGMSPQCRTARLSGIHPFLSVSPAILWSGGTAHDFDSSVTTQAAYRIIFYGEKVKGTVIFQRFHKAGGADFVHIGGEGADAEINKIP